MADAGIPHQQNPILGGRPVWNYPLTAFLRKCADILILPVSRIEPLGQIGGMVLHLIQSAGRCPPEEKGDISVPPVGARLQMRKPNSRLIGSVAYFPERYGQQLVVLALDMLTQRVPVPNTVFIKIN
jgi:hypothetical protein